MPMAGPLPFDHSAREGRGHAAGAFLHGEALAAQPVDIPGRRLIFAPGRLAEIEDMPGAGGEIALAGLDEGQGGLLRGTGHDVCGSLFRQSNV